MKIWIKIIVLLFILLNFNYLTAQSRFGGGIVAGLNGSQMDGDQAAGFHKVGANIGLRATIQTGEMDKWLLTTDILFSQRGSRSTPNDFSPIFSATLNYLEVPVMMNFRDWKKTDNSGRDYYKVYFSAGLSYGRLFSYKISPNFTHPQAVWDVFQKNDLSYTLGFSYFLNHHFGTNWRFTRSANYLFNPKQHNDNIALSSYTALQVYFVTIQAVWMF